MSARADAAGDVRWFERAGAWLGTGASPAALALGARLADRHDGPLPLLPLLVGMALISCLLALQGSFGLRRPLGEGSTLATVASGYLRPVTRHTVNALMAAGMIGWFAFNVALGGAAVGALLGVPAPATSVVLGAALLVITLAGIRHWNAVAVLAASSTVVLTGLLFWSLADRSWPLTLESTGSGLFLADVAAIVGFVALFSIRAPDFTAGFGSRSDLGRCVTLLVGSTGLFALAGMALQRGTGEGDLVVALSGPGGLGLANLFIAVALVAPSFASLHSGALALRASSRLGPVAAPAVIAAAGIGLATLRFDQMLLPWLSVLAAALPPLVLPLAVERLRRRRGHAPALVPLWTWLPGAATALALTVGGVVGAPLVGLACALVATAAWAARSGPGLSPSGPNAPTSDPDTPGPTAPGAG